MRSGSSLYLKVYNDLKESILNGRFRPGDMIPTEQELMERFSVSRITTNRALQMLTSEGFVKRRAGLGTFVSDDSHTETFASQRAPEASVEVFNSFKTDMIGFVIPFLDGSFGPSILSHTEKLLNERGMSIALAATYGDQQKEVEAIHRLIRCGVKGLIVMPVNGEYYNEAILRLHIERFPIVLVDKSLPGIPLSHVTSDNYNAAKAMTDHLISLGHQEIAFFSPELNGTSTLVDRYQGYTDSLESNGMRTSREYQLTTTPFGINVSGISTEQVENVAQFLRTHGEVTAILATDDNLSEQVYAAAMEVGRKVPDDLSIACFDGPPVKQVYWNFTHAVQNEVEMAQQCIRILDTLWSGERSEPPEAVVLPCELHLGSSTAQARKTAMS